MNADDSAIEFEQFLEKFLESYRISISFGDVDPKQQLREQARIIWDAAWKAAMSKSPSVNE